MKTHYGPARSFHENVLLINVFSIFNALTPHSCDTFQEALFHKATTANKTTLQPESLMMLLAYTDDDIKMVSPINNVYKILYVIIILALTKMHMPLTLSMAEAIE